MDYLFGQLMRADAPLLTDDLAYEMSVGRSTLTGDLKKLRAELEPCHISILGKTSKGLVLQSWETDIRNYVLEYAYEALYQDYPLDLEITELVGAVFSPGIRWRICSRETPPGRFCLRGIIPSQ